MNYLFIYYTGTYNTRFLTQKIVETLLKKDDTFQLVEIAKNVPPVEIKNFDLVGLGFPIYGFNSPRPFNQYLAKLHFPKDQKFFIYKDSGEAMAINNSASRIPLKIMRKNQCEFLGEYHFLMPYNIHFPFDPDLICKLLEEDKKLLKILKSNLQNGIVKKINRNFLTNIGAFAVSIQKVGGNFNSFFYRVDTDKCILCKLCVNHCPEKNISVQNGKIVFGHTCDMCMRCSYFCPQQAIQIGMLEKWRITDYCDLEKLWNREPPPRPYELNPATCFYKSYQKSFKKIDEEYQHLLPDF